MQFLSSQGIKAIAVNYRGASGFGYAYYRSGFAQVSTGMVSDVVDVVRGLVQHRLERDGVLEARAPRLRAHGLLVARREVERQQLAPSGADEQTAIEVMEQDV